MATIKGKAASPGVALAPAVLHRSFDLKISSQNKFDPSREKSRWESALSKVASELESLIKKFEATGPKESAEILAAHLMMVQDPEWTEGVNAYIIKNYQAEYAVDTASEDFAKMIEAVDDPYLRQRAQDIRDIKKRVITAMNAGAEKVTSQTGEFILVAEDLLPSELLSLFGPELRGLVLEKGNPTSHTTILARTFEIPLVLKAVSATQMIRDGDLIALNGLKGSVTINPDAAEIKMTMDSIARDLAEKKELVAFTKTKSVTKDGVVVEVASNLNGIMDLDFAIRKGSEGVGLFRTEFLLMDRTVAPNEEEQFQVYKKVAEGCFPHRAVIRTFDIGGDKQVSFLNLPKEDNPFLGLRGIRYCLKEKEFFKIQLRALVRAAQFGKVGIMAPMVTKIEEVFEFKQLIDEVTSELKKSGTEVKSTPELGIMIEVPSTAMIVDQLSDHLDFLSVGTNDLIQYVCAADRMNSAVADLHDAYHPGVLRILKLISDGVKNKKTWLGMCGELAAQSNYISLLIAMGFQELSVSPGAVLRTRKTVLSLDIPQCQQMLETALNAKTSSELSSLLNK